jgi:hypothetical protein
MRAVACSHHDSWNWADLSGNKPDLDARKAKFEKVWQQLATVLKDKVGMLGFYRAWCKTHDALVREASLRINQRTRWLDSGGR